MSRRSSLVSLIVSVILISLAISASNDILNDAAKKEGSGAVVTVSSPNDETNNEIISDSTEHYHESGLTAAMVDALKKIEDSTRTASSGSSGSSSASSAAEGGIDTTQKTIDFNEQLSGISDERLAEVTEVFDWLDSQMLELDESRQVERVLKRMKTFLFVQDKVSDASPDAADENGDVYNSTYLSSDLMLLEDYLHQIDNAVNFLHLNGLETLMSILTTYGTNAANGANGANRAANEVVGSEMERIEIMENTLSLLAALSNNNEDVINYVNQMNLNAKFPKLANNANDAENAKIVTSVIIKNPVLTVLDLINDELVSNLQITLTPQGKHYLSKLIYALSAMTRQNAAGLEMIETYRGKDVLYQVFASLLPQDNIASENGILLKLFRFIEDIIGLNENMSPAIINLSESNKFWEIMKHGLKMTNYGFFDFYEHRRSALGFVENIVAKGCKACLGTNVSEDEINSVMGDLDEIVRYIETEMKRNDVAAAYDEYDVEMMQLQASRAKRLVAALEEFEKLEQVEQVEQVEPETLEQEVNEPQEAIKLEL